MKIGDGFNKKRFLTHIPNPPHGKGLADGLGRSAGDPKVHSALLAFLRYIVGWKKANLASSKNSSSGIRKHPAFSAAMVEGATPEAARPARKLKQAPSQPHTQSSLIKASTPFAEDRLGRPSVDNDGDCERSGLQPRQTTTPCMRVSPEKQRTSGK